MSCQNKTHAEDGMFYLFITVRILFNYIALDCVFQSTLAKQIM